MNECQIIMSEYLNNTLWNLDSFMEDFSVEYIFLYFIYHPFTVQA